MTDASAQDALQRGVDMPARPLERESQMRAIDAFLRRVSAGRGGLVAVEAGAGLGKSTLLHWLAQRVAQQGDMQLLSARCAPSEQELTLGVALQLFERTVGAVARPDPAFRGAASLALPLFDPSSWDPGAAPGLREGLLHGLFWLTVNLSTRAPLLLVVDDVHWADSASLRFLLYLARRLDEIAVGIVVSRRPAERDSHGLLEELVGDPWSERITLPPLSERGVFQVLEHGLGEPVGAEFARAAAAAGGGNPFLTHAIVRSLRDDGIAPSDENARWIAGLRPEAVQHQLLVRTSRLGADAVAFASAAAVLDEGALFAHVAELAGLPPDAAARAGDALVDTDILASTAPVMFAHPLVRSVLYDQLPAAQRARMHARAAEILRAEQAGVEEVAVQLLRASRVGEPWAVEVLCAAAARAQAEGNPESATHYLERASREPVDAEHLSAILLALGDAQAQLGEPAAESTVLRALELIAEPNSRARCLQALGTIQYTRGELRAAAATFGRAIGLLEERADDELARDLHAGYFSVASLVPELADEARVHVEPLLRRPAGGETAAERSALAAMAAFHASSGAPRDQAIALARRAWGDGALLREEGAGGWAWSLVTGALTWTDEFASSLSISHAVMEEARRIGSVTAYANANFTAQATYWTGRLDEGRAYGEAVLDARRSGWRAFLGTALGLQARILIEQDELDAAETVLSSAGELDDNADGAAWLAARGRLLLVQGRPNEALTDLLSAGEVLDRVRFVNPVMAPWRIDAALAHHQLSQLDAARKLLAEVAEIAERSGTPTHRAMLLRTEAVLVDPPEAADLLEQALELLTESEAQLERLRCLAALGWVRRRAGRRKEATAAVGAAHELARRLSARRLERQLAAELKVLGARPRPRRYGGADALTASERRVAELAAGGLANREIAEALFVTPRTVEQHLYNTYKKLGIKTRAKLAEVLATTAD